MQAPRVSIILPTLNGERDLERLLPMLAKQRFDGEIEIRAVDSDSSDRSRELLGAAGASVTRIAQSEFKHGATRNLVAKDSTADYLVFVSQDALPRDESFVASLVRAFEDPRVAGAYARILPHPGDDPLTARTALDAPEARDVPETRELGAGRSLAALAPAERSRSCEFNNVASAIRRRVFETIPFPDVEFGEDATWAARALEAGWRIRFTPESVVYHAHRYTPRTAFARNKIDAQFQRDVHGRVLRPTLASVLRGIAYEVKRDAIYVVNHGGALHLLRSPGLRTGQVLGQWSGSHGA
jgi:rhamnosyltransferase